MILYQDAQKLREVLQSLRESDVSDFYSSRFSGTKEQLRLEELPLLTRDDLAKVHPRQRLYVSPEEVRFIAATSGTTSGSPLLSYFSNVENYHIDPAWGAEVKRLLVVFPPLNKVFGGSFIQQCAQAPRPLTPVFGDLQNMATSAVLAAETECDALYVTPSYAMALAPELKRYYSTAAFKLLVISGETIGESKLASLRALYPNAKIANLYASSEIGQFIMGPTPEMLSDNQIGFFPLTKALTALELIEGELVVTYTANKAFPLIRYRTGDHFEIDEQLTAKYGRDAIPVLQWSGKGGVDVVRVNGLEFRVGSVDDFFAQLPQKITGYQLHIEGDANAPSVRLECVLSAGAEAMLSVIQKQFITSFTVDRLGVVKDALERGALESAEVVMVESLSHESVKRRVLVNHIG